MSLSGFSIRVMVASQTIFGSVLSLFSLLEEFQWDWFKFFLVCLVAFTYEAIRSWTSICREIFVFVFLIDSIWLRRHTSAAERSYPTSKARGRSREDPMPEGWQPRGATYHMSDVRGGGREEQPHIQGVMAARV